MGTKTGDTAPIWKIVFISWENNRDCHITMPLSLKTVEVQIKVDHWNKRFRTVQVCWQRLASNLSDIKWRSTFEMEAVPLRSDTEITTKSLFLYVSRSHTRYGFRADARAFRFSVNVIKNETVVPGRQSVIVRWGYYCKCTAYKSEFPCCRPFHLSSDLLTYAVFGYYRKPLYIDVVFPYSMPVQVKLLWIQFFCCDLGPVYVEVGDPR